MAVHFSENTLILNITRILFTFGLWPSPTTHTIYSMYCYVLHIFVSFAYTIFQIVNLLMSINNVDRFIESVYSTLTLTAYLWKLSNYLYYKSHIINCLKKLQHLQRKNRSIERIFRAKLTSLNQLTVVIFFGAYCTVIAAALKTLLSETPVLPVASWYPLDWQHNSRDFWIVFTHSVLGAFIVGHVNLSMDTYVYYLMAMTTAQFEMLSLHIKELGANMDVEPTQKLHKRALRDNNFSLNLCLVEHQIILEFSSHLQLEYEDEVSYYLCLFVISLVADVERYFSIQFFAQICLSGTVLGCGIYHLNTVSPMGNFFQFMYLLAFMTTVTMETFLYTYFGHGVLQSSDELSSALYSSKWYQLLPDLGKPLIILMERLKRKREILAGKLFPINLALFGKIMDLSYRLYLFLKTV